jgi:hypothetical protein
MRLKYEEELKENNYNKNKLKRQTCPTSET